MTEHTSLGDDQVFRASWAELLRQIRTAGAADATFWAALGEDIAASESAREALAETWTQAGGEWSVALPRYRWWMQDHAELFPTVNAIAVETALAKVAERVAKESGAKKGAKRPKTELH